MGHRGRDRMVVEFTTTYAISAYRHERCELESHSGEVYSIQHYVIKFFTNLRQVGFSLGTMVSFTNKTDFNDITEILLKVVLNTITLIPNSQKSSSGILVFSNNKTNQPDIK